MAKKHLEELGSIDDYQAPWETASGETEINKDRLRKFLFGLLRDKASAQDARDEAVAKVSAAESERDEAKSELAKKGDPDLAGKLEKAEAKVRDLETKDAERVKADERNGWLEEIGEDTGLTKKQLARLQGDTKDALEKDAKTYMEDNGLEKRDPDEDPEDPEDESGLRRTPRSVRNGGDPEHEASAPKGRDFYEKAAEEIMGNRIFT